MKKIFEFTGKLPQTDSIVTFYNTSRSIEEKGKTADLRMQKLSKIFGINSKMVDLGDTYQLQEKSKMLTIYPASDSFWFQDDEFFACEDKKQSKNVPDSKAANDIAIEFLKKNDLLLPNASKPTVSYTTVVIDKDGGKTIEEYNTEIHLNFRYTIDKLPVFGPGAKTRVSLIDNKTISGVYHFWREPVNVAEKIVAEKSIESKRKLLTPENALDLFSENMRFAQLKEGAAKVVIKNMELGYFAMSPTEEQTYLIPVYRYQGIVSTEVFENHEFDLHSVAINYTENDLKSMGISICSRGVSSGNKYLVF
jgi:hypothetical protein